MTNLISFYSIMMSGSSSVKRYEIRSFPFPAIFVHIIASFIVKFVIFIVKFASFIVKIVIFIVKFASFIIKIVIFIVKIVIFIVKIAIFIMKVVIFRLKIAIFIMKIVIFLLKIAIFIMKVVIFLLKIVIFSLKVTTFRRNISPASFFASSKTFISDVKTGISWNLSWRYSLYYRKILGKDWGGDLTIKPEIAATLQLFTPKQEVLISS